MAAVAAGTSQPPSGTRAGRPIVVPDALARAMLARARRLDVGLGGRYLVDDDRVSIWGEPGSEDAEPIGGFRVDHAHPGDGWATLHALWWDPARSDEKALRSSIRRLAGRLGDRPARAELGRSTRALGKSA